MLIEDAQADLRDAHTGGATGVLASAVVWSSAAAVALWGPEPHAMWTLLVGGMFIYPAGVLGDKLLGRRGRTQPGNPLTALALDGTLAMLLGLMLAVALAQFRPVWFFPAVLLVIGGRYFSFATLYGRWQFRLLGGVLAGLGMAAVALQLSPFVCAGLAAGVEWLFGLWWLLRQRPWQGSRATPWVPDAA